MEITWLGTAGFSIASGECRFLIDPFLGRDPKPGPFTASRIFISHGHFDHLMDVPGILESAPQALVHCSPTAGHTLEKHGVSTHRIRRAAHTGYLTTFNRVTAQAFFSRHIRFDRPLVLSTLARTGLQLFRLIKLFTHYPCGRVLAWRFSLEGKTLLHFGSGGATPGELAAMSRPDILLIPLQGHTDICRIAADQVRILKPGMVIPHHHDNFYPPISQSIDIRPFLDQVKRESPDTRIRVPEPHTPIRI